MLRQRTLELALDGRIQLGSLPRLTMPVERVADAFEALTRPVQVFQTALSYDAA